MKNLKVVVTGAQGKMGKRLLAILAETPGVVILGGVEKPGSALSETIIAGAEQVGEKLVFIVDEPHAAMEGADVIIAFPNDPEAAIQHAEVAAEWEKRIVIGTTGLTKKHENKLIDLSQVMPIVVASNMSMGVNLLLNVVPDMAKALGDGYDCEIIEAHHREKKDAPSGTAIKLAQAIASALNRNLDEHAVYERRGMIGARKPKEIGIQTIRGGDIVGEHTVILAGLGERIELTHRVSNRDTFAQGAVRAALWIADKPAGLYDMQDVLGLR